MDWYYCWIMFRECSIIIIVCFINGIQFQINDLISFHFQWFVCIFLSTETKLIKSAHFPLRIDVRYPSIKETLKNLIGNEGSSEFTLQTSGGEEVSSNWKTQNLEKSSLDLNRLFPLFIVRLRGLRISWRFSVTSF